MNLIALSPHYFFRERYPAGISRSRFLRLERERNDRVRKEICEKLLRPYLRPDQTVLDYGCGPGFRARHVSGLVKKIYAGDISSGVIACARIVNSAPNLEYFTVRPAGSPPFIAGTLDLIYSFAVIQHLSNRIFQDLLNDFYRWLKPGGRAALHIVADDRNWKTEEEWRGDLSLSGRLRYRCGVHCFGRSGREVEKMITAAGFTGVEHLQIPDLALIDDDIGSQSLFVFAKSGKI